MVKIDTLVDPLRTIPAGRLAGLVHQTVAEGRKFKTLCGDDIGKKDLLIMLQYPDDITCRKCLLRMSPAGK